MNLSRRSFFIKGAAFVAYAPAIVRASSLMSVKVWPGGIYATEPVNSIYADLWVPSLVVQIYERSPILELLIGAA